MCALRVKAIHGYEGRMIVMLCNITYSSHPLVPTLASVCALPAAVQYMQVYVRGVSVGNVDDAGAYRGVVLWLDWTEFVSTSMVQNRRTYKLPN